MTTNTSYRFGEILWAEIPYTDETGAKKRPAVVVSSPRYNRERPELLVMPVTSQLHHGDTYGTVTISEWQQAGLPKPSVIKPLILPILKTRVLEKAGTLAKVDKDTIRKTLTEILSSDF